VTVPDTRTQHGPSRATAAAAATSLRQQPAAPALHKNMFYPAALKQSSSQPETAPEVRPVALQ
jgi:hypothetical protein